MGKRKRNSVNPFKKDKERASKKGNPIYRVAGGAGLKARGGSKKEVNLHNQALVEKLDQQLGEQQQQAALNKSQKKPSKPATTLPPPPPQEAEKTVDERVDELSETLQQASA